MAEFDGNVCPCLCVCVCVCCAQESSARDPAWHSHTHDTHVYFFSAAALNPSRSLPDPSGCVFHLS